MADAVLDIEMTAEEYLTWEREQAQRHEFDGGRVVAMAGGSPRHNALCAAVIGDLRAAYRGSECRVLSSDQRVSLRMRNKYVYPDTTVICGRLELEAGTTDVATNPRVIVEVLCRRTESNDRGAKWEGYRRLATLEDYVLVSQRTISVEHFHRLDDGSWRYTVAGAGERVIVAGGAVLDVDSLYQDVFELPSDVDLES